MEEIELTDDMRVKNSCECILYFFTRFSIQQDKGSLVHNLSFSVFEIRIPAGEKTLANPAEVLKVT